MVFERENTRRRELGRLKRTCSPSSEPSVLEARDIALLQSLPSIPRGRQRERERERERERLDPAIGVACSNQDQQEPVD